MSKSNKVFYIMGVSGSGKSTVGKQLADHLQIPFYDGDDFHPEANIRKMQSGQPLNDDDRAGWLDSIQKFAVEALSQGSLIIACSALKAIYRQTLNEGISSQWIYLKGDYELIWERMQTRQGHFMPAKLLQSQFDALEEPTGKEIITASIDQPIEAIIQDILTQINTA